MEEWEKRTKEDGEKKKKKGDRRSGTKRRGVRMNSGMGEEKRNERLMKGQ